MGGQVATCPYGIITTINVGAYRFKLHIGGCYEKDLGLWVERLVDFRYRRYCDVGAKEMYTARCPKTRPPGHEGTKADLKRGNDMGRPLHAFFDFVTGLFTRKPKLKVTHRTTSFAGNTNGKTTTAPGKPSQKEIDLILDKISSSGYESLSKEEKQKLFQASQKE